MRVRCFVFFAAACCACFSWAKEQAAGQRDLSIEEFQSEVASHAAQPRFAAASWGIKIVSLDSGATLFETNAHKLLKPASNAKLYTAALALDALGPDFRIRTSVFSHSQPDPDGTLKGDLIIFGRGDPSFAARFENGQYTNLLGPLVEAIRSAGIKRVEGNLIGDETFFVGPHYGSTWAWDDLGYYYGAEISALTVQDNVIDLFVKPGTSPGQPCRISTKPETSYLEFVNRATTVATSAQTHISIYRPPGKNRAYISGYLPATYGTWVDSVSVSNPALWFLTMLKETLARDGITVSGELKTRSWPEDSKLDLAELHELAHTDSQPVSVIIEKMMKASENLYAELLLREVGAQKGEPNASSSTATEELGLRELRNFITHAGLNRAEVLMEDGSGLSRGGLVTPNATVELLKIMSKHKDAEVFRNSLPEAGQDGTLKTRLQDLKGNVRAKTGSLRFVTALSGYLTNRAGEHLAFSILLNGYNNLTATSARDEVDAIPRMISRIKVKSGTNGAVEPK
ncbi:MAG TPA: D-alanyl-D-alanine carboxypeptidase/D-alanyl-D-alanine-endopeptidase [Verrucomicrobiae bacterium]|nr:D-alanyl-D-alanine carboxypeptidase/D-alanyl-D-alanine-endopeptidase [Verrucomicrobiae bacterium]